MKSALHLIVILHRMFGVFFLDISKAFDNVWHEGLLFKLKMYGVKEKLLNLLRNYTYGVKGELLNLLRNYMYDVKE